MRHLLALGIVSLTILLTAPGACAQDGNTPPSQYGDQGENQQTPPSTQTPSSQDREGIDLNRQRVTLPGRTAARKYDPFFGYSELLLGGGGSAVLDRGDEYYTDAEFAYAQLGIRHTGWEVGDAYIQLGLQFFGDGAVFESRTWEGSQFRVGGGPSLTMFPKVGIGERPFWSLNVRTMFSFEHEEGKSRTSTYELYGQDTVAFNLQAFLEIYPFMPDDMTKRDRRGREFETGWLPAIQLRIDADMPISVDRQSTAKDLGFRDPDVDKRRLAANLITYIRREGTTLGILDWGLVFGAENRYAAGYETIDHGHSVLIINAGLTTRIQLFQPVFVYLNAGVNYEIETGRIGGSVTASIQLLELAEGLEKWIRE